jgi:hypothetical protein
LHRRRGGNTGLGVRDCPYCNAGQDQSGGAGSQPPKEWLLSLAQ